MIDSAGDPMRVAVSPWMDIDCQGSDRFEALLLPALVQTLEPLRVAAAQLRVALAVGLPAARPGLPRDLDVTVRAAISKGLPDVFSAVAIFPVGHASGLLGLYAACEKIAAGAYDACVVAGVESYLAPDTLEWLEKNDQLHGAGRLNNAWGFIPGEAAGAALLVSENALTRIGGDPLAQVLSIGRSIEEKRIKTDSVCIGEGLTTAFREGLAGLPAGARVTDVFCDMNGEPYRADEFGFATLRTSESFVSASDFVAPADCWGDVSAASAPLGLMLATIAGRKAYAKGPYSLLWASSESGERAAALLAVASLPRT